MLEPRGAGQDVWRLGPPGAANPLESEIIKESLPLGRVALAIGMSGVGGVAEVVGGLVEGIRSSVRVQQAQEIGANLLRNL